jgi:hypothetical protein
MLKRKSSVIPLSVMRLVLGARLICAFHRPDIKKESKKARKETTGSDEVSLAIYRLGDLY